MKRYIKAVSVVCALAATTTLCAGALAEGDIPKLAEGMHVAAPVVRAMAPDAADIVRLAEADVLVKADSLGQIDKSVELGTDGTPALKNPVERIVALDGAVEKSLALDDEFVKKDVERVVALDGAAVEKSLALDADFTKKDVERVVAIEGAAEKSLALDDEFVKKNVECVVALDGAAVEKSLALDADFTKKDVERALQFEGAGMEKSGMLESTEPFVKKDADMVDRAIEDAGATKVLNPFDPEEGSDVVRGPSDEMIDKRVIADGEISEKHTDKYIDIELGRDDISRGIALGDGGAIVRSQSLGGENGIGRLGEGEVIRP
ncbi:MAG: hypothetical protein Q4C10_05240 [Clostridia bacterium]|nr:hypothetical protein [Clostridia bacterium]